MDGFLHLESTSIRINVSRLCTARSLAMAKIVFIFKHCHSVVPISGIPSGGRLVLESWPSARLPHEPVQLFAAIFGTGQGRFTALDPFRDSILEVIDIFHPDLAVKKIADLRGATA